MMLVSQHCHYYTNSSPTSWTHRYISKLGPVYPVRTKPHLYNEGTPVVKLRDRDPLSMSSWTHTHTHTHPNPAMVFSNCMRFLYFEVCIQDVEKWELLELKVDLLDLTPLQKPNFSLIFCQTWFFCLICQMSWETAWELKGALDNFSLIHRFLYYKMCIPM